MGRLAPYLPFSASHARQTPVDWRQALMRVPFVLAFLLAAWALFLGWVRPNGWIPDAVRPNVGFIGNLWMLDPVRAVAASNFGIVVQHSWSQIIYATVLLVLFGIPYETYEGTLRTFLVFYGASIIGVGILTLTILMTPLGGASGYSGWVAQTSWSGASVGGFGVLGAYCATARNPWGLLAVFAGYELFFELQLVPALPLLAFWMHIAGFTFGFAVSRIAHMNVAASASAPSPTPVSDEPAPPQ